VSKKTVSPSAIVALKEALTDVYWYKGDLRSFLNCTLDNPEILARVNWEEYKRNIVGFVVDFLAKRQDEFQPDLLKLMTEVTSINDFSHLTRLEDGDVKVAKAKAAVLALKKLTVAHESLYEEQRKVEKRRSVAFQKLLKTTSVQDKLLELTKIYYDLLSSNDFHARGYALEKVLKELFTLFDLDPKAAFKITGEQIDGAFSFDGTDYLIEAKWQKELVSTKELDSLSGKLSRKLDNTLGVYLSINGYSEDAVKLHSSGRSLMILIDGSDIMAVLEGRIDLLQLMLRKRRHASQTGNIYLRIDEIL
jgi:hypothetical protein